MTNIHKDSKKVVNITEIERIGDADAGVGYELWQDKVGVTVWPQINTGGNDEGYRMDLLLQDIRMRVPKEVKFGISSSDTKTYIYLYVADQQFAMGWVAYGDLSVGKNSARKYAVWSPRIYNSKFRNRANRDSNLNRRMHTSKNIRPILQHVENFVRPVSAYETAKTSIDAFFDCVKQTDKDAGSGIKWAMASAGIGQDGPLTVELRRLFESGHKFIDPVLQDNIATLVAKTKELEKIRIPEYKLYFVRLYVRDGQQYLDVINIVSDDEAPLHTDTFHKASLSLETDTYTWEALPENLKLKVSTINTLPIGDHVFGVGYRAEQNIYYVCEEVTA